MNDMPSQVKRDADLLEEMLECVTSVHGEIDAQIYARMFERCPHAAGMFKVIDPSQPPHGCGQMVFEIVSLLLDLAQDKPYVPSYLRQISHEHAAFGVDNRLYYAEFLRALTDVMARLADQAWTPDHAAAWERQTQRMMDIIALSG